ncbi:Embryo sac development arrest 6 [Hirschfeldia incana]|nr:Embryo sac development arrest 6 [Hirschfeldia incana]
MSQNHHARTVQTTGASKKRKDTTESGLDNDPRATPAASNWVLAGYMAHEFLTCGTMLGRKLYPGWAEVGPLDTPSTQQQNGEVKKQKTDQSYSDVSSVFKTDGIHIPGVVNPTQLAKWIQM